MNKTIEMTSSEAFDYMNYLQKTYGDDKAREFFMKMSASTPSESAPASTGHTGIAWVEKGMTNGSQWWHDKYEVVAEIVDENSEKGGVQYKFVQGKKYYSPDIVSELNDITSFSGFGRVIENSNAALEHGHWHCIRAGRPTTRARKGYVAQVGDTIRRAYTKNGFKAS